jgi:hypothetical protein
MQKQERAKKQGFDLRTHIRDGKGNIVQEQPYRLHINGDKREYERPPGSGNFYTEGGTLLRKGKDLPPPVKEVSVEELQKQIAELKAKLAGQDPVVGEAELPEVHMTVDDVQVSDVPSVPASQADNSEEEALMAQAKKQDTKFSFWNKGR